jgi:hypothetical protein
MRSFVTSGETDEMREFYCFGESIDLKVSRRRARTRDLAEARRSIADAEAGEGGERPHPRN